MTSNRGVPADTSIKNIAFYIFFTPAFDLAEARGILLEGMRAHGIKGTILLAPEGINCNISGPGKAMDQFCETIHRIIGQIPAQVKVSYSGRVSFKRAVVKIKPFIVARPGETPVDPRQDTAPYITPEEFHQWLSSGKKMITLDTRNGYEFERGRFKSAVHLGTKHFAHFEDDLQQAPAEWKQAPVVTFCTGGIRCEKAAPLLLKKGFKEVYQLEGGILNYFEKLGRGHFEGECFVFDERVALDEHLLPKG